MKTYKIVVGADAFSKAEKKLPDSLTWEDGEIEIAEVIEHD